MIYDSVHRNWLWEARYEKVGVFRQNLQKLMNKTKKIISQASFDGW